MSVVEQRAWFVLADCMAAAIAVAAIYAVTGNFDAALGGMGVLGISGWQR